MRASARATHRRTRRSRGAGRRRAAPAAAEVARAGQRRRAAQALRRSSGSRAAAALGDRDQAARREVGAHNEPGERQPDEDRRAGHRRHGANVLAISVSVPGRPSSTSSTSRPPYRCTEQEVGEGSATRATAAIAGTASATGACRPRTRTRSAARASSRAPARGRRADSRPLERVERGQVGLFARRCPRRSGTRPPPASST